MAKSLCPRQQGSDQGQQGVEIGGQVDVHVGHHLRLAERPHGAEGRLFPLSPSRRLGRPAIVAASVDAMGQVSSVLALSAMETRAVNGELRVQVGQERPNACFEHGLLVVDGDHDLHIGRSRRSLHGRV